MKKCDCIVAIGLGSNPYYKKCIGGFPVWEQRENTLNIYCYYCPLCGKKLTGKEQK